MERLISLILPEQPKRPKGHTYTHMDKHGMLWRFEGSRPISKLADEAMAEFGFDVKIEPMSDIKQRQQEK
jgi:hypothetical protein